MVETPFLLAALRSTLGYIAVKKVKCSGSSGGVYGYVKILYLFLLGGHHESRISVATSVLFGPTIEVDRV